MLEALAEGFKALSQGTVVAPPRNGVDVPNGFLLSMPGWVPGKSISVKLVAGFHDNHKLGLPGHQAIICLFDGETGTPLAVMDGTGITALRTAGGAALSTRLLARKEARTLAIVGAGVQGQAHLQVVPTVRDIQEIRIASLFPADAEKLAARDPRATAYGSYEEAVRGADLVCLCTSSSEPVITFDMLSPGAHVTSVGYAPPGGELDRSIVEGGRLFVETAMAFADPPAGCAELRGLDASAGAELGEVLLGRKPGRQSDDEITVYKAMGHAMEDLVAAQIVYDLAKAAGIGQTFDLRGA
ncbi:MAG: ornithine cyclodeaminase family protein [Thermomicrobiales bacterium]|nr:ornithine cyclodeaminase family protein [Thermomicrobiales bacterium]